MENQNANSATRPELVRAIGLRSAVLLVITNVIGSAIFLTPGTMAATLPSEPLLLVAWIAGGIIALCGGLTYAEMGAMYPRSGGLYVYLEEAFGPLVAFLHGWAGLLVMLTGATAAVAMGFATYFAYFVPALSTTHIVVSIPYRGEPGPSQRRRFWRQFPFKLSARSTTSESRPATACRPRSQLSR